MEDSILLLPLVCSLTYQKSNVSEYLDLCAYVIFFPASAFCVPGFGPKCPPAQCRGHPLRFGSPFHPRENETEVLQMTTINLKEFFYWYMTDEVIEVTGERSEELRKDKRYEYTH